jgi:hypothetical protein
VETFTATGPVRDNIQQMHGDTRISTTPGTEVHVELTGHGRDAAAFVEQTRIEFADDTLRLDMPRQGWGMVREDFDEAFGTDSDGVDQRNFLDRLGDLARGVGRSVGSFKGRLDVVVQVPDDSTVVLSTGAGDVDVTGRLRSVTASTGAGGVSVAGSHDSINASSGAGDVRTDATASSVRLKSGVGDVSIEDLNGSANLTTGTGEVRVGRAHSGDLRASTGVGNVQIGIPEGTAALLDLSTGVGSKRVDLEPSPEGPTGTQQVQIHASSGTGDLVVRRA